MENITFEDFSKLKIIAVTITDAVLVEKSEKLIKLICEDGTEEARTILTGMAPWYSPEEFIGMKTLIISNLAPRNMMGFESRGMLLSIENQDSTVKPIIIRLPDDVVNGSLVC